MRRRTLHSQCRFNLDVDDASRHRHEDNAPLPPRFFWTRHRKHRRQTSNCSSTRSERSRLSLNKNDAFSCRHDDNVPSRPPGLLDPGLDRSLTCIDARLSFSTSPCERRAGRVAKFSNKRTTRRSQVIAVRIADATRRFDRELASHIPHDLASESEQITFFDIAR